MSKFKITVGRQELTKPIRDQLESRLRAIPGLRTIQVKAIVKHGFITLEDEHLTEEFLANQLKVINKNYANLEIEQIQNGGENNANGGENHELESDLRNARFEIVRLKQDYVEIQEKYSAETTALRSENEVLRKENEGLNSLLFNEQNIREENIRNMTLDEYVSNYLAVVEAPKFRRLTERFDDVIRTALECGTCETRYLIDAIKFLEDSPQAVKDLTSAEEKATIALAEIEKIKKAKELLGELTLAGIKIDDSAARRAIEEFSRKQREYKDKLDVGIFYRDSFGMNNEVKYIISASDSNRILILPFARREGQELHQLERVVLDSLQKGYAIKEQRVAQTALGLYVVSNAGEEVLNEERAKKIEQESDASVLGVKLKSILVRC